MTKSKLKHLLDILPFVVLCVWAATSITRMIIDHNLIQWQHYLGILFLIATGVLFKKHHQSGVLFLGVTILLALFCILSFNVGLVQSSFFWTPADNRIPLFWGNPIMLLFLLGHVCLSGRWYFGIATKKYWELYRTSRHYGQTKDSGE